MERFILGKSLPTTREAILKHRTELYGMQTARWLDQQQFGAQVQSVKKDKAKLFGIDILPS